jgi:hypothetical protein
MSREYEQPQQQIESNALNLEDNRELSETELEEVVGGWRGHSRRRPPRRRRGRRGW